MEISIDTLSSNHAQMANSTTAAASATVAAGAAMIAAALPDKKLCLNETPETVTSISTPNFAPQPIDEKCHFVQNRLFVGGIPKHTTSKDLAVLFRTYGKVIDTNIVQAEHWQWNYGFVTFHPKQMSASDIVLAEYFYGKDFSIKGKALKVSRAVFKPRKNKLITVGNGDICLQSITGRTIVSKQSQTVSTAESQPSHTVPPPAQCINEVPVVSGPKLNSQSNFNYVCMLNDQKKPPNGINPRSSGTDPLYLCSPASSTLLPQRMVPWGGATVTVPPPITVPAPVTTLPFTAPPPPPEQIHFRPQQPPIGTAAAAVSPMMRSGCSIVSMPR